MTSEEEIRLFGYPISFRVPGEKDEHYVPHNRHNQQPILVAGQKYEGYSLDDIDRIWSKNNIFFIDSNNKLQGLSDYPQIDWYDNVNFFKRQHTVTYERIHKMLLCLYDKILELENK